MNNTNLHSWAHPILRVGLSLVVIWFGFSQLTSPSEWTNLVPSYATNLTTLSAHTLVLMNGIFEILFGLTLFLGLYTRVVAGILTLHLVHILFTVGYNPIGVRDFGLAVAMLLCFLHGPDAWSLDTKIEKNIDIER